MAPGRRTFNPADRYPVSGGRARRWAARWFHNSRLRDFADIIDPAESLLSVGAGFADLESTLLNERFERIYTIEPRRSPAEVAADKGLDSVQGAVPPIPFQNESLNAIMIVGAIEHLPDDREFLEDSIRCLRDGGRLYATLPVEVGLGGLIRHIGKNFVHPSRGDSPNGLRRFVDFSLAELRKTTSRERHGTFHRYYNYTYALDDIQELFSNHTVRGWPFRRLGAVNLILFVVAEK